MSDKIQDIIEEQELNDYMTIHNVMDVWSNGSDIVDKADMPSHSKVGSFRKMVAIIVEVRDE